ncbi:MAG TPA: TonB-dependent receptor [Sphingomonas sp.]|uniref:TonB-dependent receptor domain-containing protein n=1 Tax=Sphingomonas sp. TaxID=28214 RepID=UPI002BFE7868|nr:TonB-dependent receptor [Sphingomonas sp.]HMI21100.1 TonB-dependent receptor [Sphingomonas sp.]
MTQKIFNRALLSASTMALGLVLAAPAFAQAAAPADATPAADNGEVVITGTLFRNAAAATASPVTVISSEDLARRGVNTISDAVQSLSANNAGSMNQNWTGFNFATGATAVSLRGLTTGNTLTIFDGLRSAPYPLADDGHRNFVDLNTIPQAIVDRVEVLQDGASSTYGADAVAGVVNVIVKKEIVGLHMNASGGISQRGDAGEQRVDATAGYGSLSENGFNAYVNVEYQHNDALFARDRGYPYNSSDLSKICNDAGSCMTNNDASGIQANGTFLGLGTTTVPFVRPYTAGGAAVTGGRYQMLNPSAGCQNLVSQPLTTAQQGASNPAVVCTQDLQHDYFMEQPRTSRFGTTARVTANVGSHAQAYAMFNYYQTQTFSQISPLAYAGQTAAGGNTFVLNPLLLPIYVCPRTTVGACSAANGTLNPNNPFAALNEQARLVLRYDRPRETFTNSQAFRYSAGINGSFGDDWVYTADFTKSHVALKVRNENYFFASHLVDVINDGSYNFVNQTANTEAQRQYIAPTSINRSSSDLWQAQATLAKSFFQLPGGAFQVAVGVAYRHEAIDNPSANPVNNDSPADRYYSINAVGVEGSRNVKSAFFEADAPVFDMLELKASGRYDKYSSGQKNFSPKVEAQFKPIRQIKLRGTYSKGFRIPSFNEAYGLPTTGYVTTQLDPTHNANDAAFVAAHGGNAYSTLPYSYGLTATGNPNLKPEKSRSYTLGTVFEPTSRLSFTVDYWNIHIKNLISNADYSDVIPQYYANNGVVNVPGITVKPGLADPEHPGALPLLGFIEYSFENANSEDASGIDLSAQARFNIGGVRWTTHATASWLRKLQKTIGGVVQRYDGTLSPCDVTSCSGAPKWRGTWQNTFDVGKFSTTFTTYYTGGYDMASTDYGGVKGDCEANVGASVVTYQDGSPVKCHGPKYVQVDMTASYQVTDKLQMYVNILDLLDKKAPFDPSAAYSLYQYNPAWASGGFTGRYFRVGARVDF